jgi:ORF6N domain
MATNLIIREENIASIIYQIRGEKVMLDMDLSMLYGVETKVFKQSIRRNIKRFPPDFMFELTSAEFENLKSQLATSSWGGTRYPPFAFTEQGVAMLSGVLNSDRAIAVNIIVMRTFVQMRKLLSSNIELTNRLNNLEDIIYDKLDEQDDEIRAIHDALDELMSVDKPKTRKPIGFK